uniref:Uncharacterized protein n=1 Tax=Arundo donax TaxID=35708 RepID=A0A0A9FTF0_ARUDO
MCTRSGWCSWSC